MRIELKWSDGMQFEGQAEAHTIAMDAKAPLGKNSGPTPKELVVMGLGGCTAMDVISLLKKFKQLPRSFHVDVEVESSTGVQPAVFTKGRITYQVEGEVDPERLLEAVRLSQTKYCGVSSMLSKAFPIHYNVQLNGREIGTGQASFT